MKKFFLALSLSFLLIGGTVLASPNGEPFQALWNEISDLKTQIENIQLIPGPQGPQGEKGDIGPQGLSGTISNTFFISRSVTGGGWDTVTSDASCPSGSMLISGGAKVEPAIISRAFIQASYPLSTTTWRAIATALDQGAGSVTLTTYAVCSTINL